jgi:hypothetical protein
MRVQIPLDSKCKRHRNHSLKARNDRKRVASQIKPGHLWTCSWAKAFRWVKPPGGRLVLLAVSFSRVVTNSLEAKN